MTIEGLRLRNDPSGWRAGAWAVAAAGGVAAASLVGWLEEVARSQAVEHYYGLPLTVSADPRAAAAFAALPFAVAIVVDLLLLGALAALVGHRWWLGVIAGAVGATMLVQPPRSWAQFALEAIAAAGVAAAVCGVIAINHLRFASVARAAAAYAVRRRGTAGGRLGGLSREVRWFIGVAVAAVAVAAAVWLPLWAGDRAGREEARDATSFFVVADRSCDPTMAVLWFGDDGNLRRVRVAHRAGPAWTLAPGLFTVPLDEALAQVRLGHLNRSVAAPFPLRVVPLLPRRCAR